MDPDETTSTAKLSRSRISRRKLIGTAATVGGAVWVAPVIESFASKAAAASAPTLNFGCSWVYVVWLDASGSVVYTGWQGDKNTTCNSDAAYPRHKASVTKACGNNSFTLNPTKGAPPSISYTVGRKSGTLTSTTSDCNDFTYSGTGSRTIVLVYRISGRGRVEAGSG